SLFSLRITPLTRVRHSFPTRRSSDRPGQLYAGARGPLAGAVGDVDAGRVAHRAAGQLLLPVNLAAEGEVGIQSVLALHARLGHAGLVAVLLAQAEARRLAAQIGEEIEPLAAMLPLQQPGIAAAVRSGAIGVARGRLGTQFVVFAQAEARVHAQQLAAGLHVLVAQVGDARAQPAFHGPDADPAATVEELVAGAVGFVLGDDPVRIEVEVAAGDRLAEEQRAVRVVDVVIDVPDQFPGREDLLAV